MVNKARKSNARRPDINFELARLAALLTAAVETTGKTVDAPALARDTAHYLSTHPAHPDEKTVDACHLTNRRLSCRAVSQATVAQLAQLRVDAEQAFKTATNSTRVSRTDIQMLNALHRANVPAQSLDPEDLHPYRRRIVVRHLERLRRLRSLEAYARENLALELGVVFDATSKAPRDKVASELQDAGIDARMLLEALARVEAGRHLNLVRHQANRLVRSYGGYSADDFMGWGWRGLVASLLAYDPTTYAFSTYACTRITGSIQDGVRSESPLPKRLATYARQVRAAQSSLGQSLGREPSREELAHAIALDRLLTELGREPSPSELSERTAVETRSLSVIPRLTTPTSFDESPTELAGDSNPEDAALRDLTHRAVHDAIATLPDEEAEAIRLLDLEGLTLEQARSLTGATTRQLRSRRARGRTQLGEALADWS